MMVESSFSSPVLSRVGLLFEKRLEVSAESMLLCPAALIASVLCVPMAAAEHQSILGYHQTELAASKYVLGPPTSSCAAHEAIVVA